MLCCVQVLLVNHTFIYCGSRKYDVLVCSSSSRYTVLNVCYNLVISGFRIFFFFNVLRELTLNIYAIKPSDFKISNAAVDILYVFLDYFGWTETYCINVDKDILFLPFKFKPQVIQFVYNALCIFDVISY